MVIVAGHLNVDPEQRERYVAGCTDVIERGRSSPGCLDFAISADAVDPGRINIFERWQSPAAVQRFRGTGPSDEQAQAIISASVMEYDVTEARTLT
ncbi:MAG: hypothetical protein JWR32_5700 [Mycobacterium sp.]|jgi:quinol monooxygenase YgiN|nr:hypothetical protein [Mycobacterium sp.]